MVSIIIPVYNASHYLSRCIESVRNQSFTEWELLLINDGSTDSSESIIKEYVELDKRIKLYNKDNGGVSSARNYGIKHANGKYIMFLDSDDWFSAEMCEKMIDTIKLKGADCVICGFQQTHGHIWAPSYNIDYASLDEFKKDFTYWLNTELLSSSVNKIYRRDLLGELFPESMSFGEDLIFSLNYLNKCTRISFISSPLYQHEVFNTTSITHSFDQNRFREIENIQQAVLCFNNDLSSSAYFKYYRDVLRHIKMLFRQRELSDIEKTKIASQWLSDSYYKKMNLADCSESMLQLIYAKMVQSGHWKLLCLLHNMKNRINDLKCSIQP